MKDCTTIWVGLDVHKDTISSCSLVGDGTEETACTFANTERELRRHVKKLASKGTLRVCYEAGPCGYHVRRQLEAMGVDCVVIAPSLIPTKAGDRVKTDRRDARKLVRYFRAGELTPIRVPTEAEEAVRDLVRARDQLRKDAARQRHRLAKFLLRHGLVWRETRNWTKAHWAWMRKLKLEQPAAQKTLEEYLTIVDFALDRLKALDVDLAEVAEQQPWKSQVDRLRCLRGIDTLSALSIVVEIQDFRRFTKPGELMSFVGMTPSQHSSGGKTRTGAITKAGNGRVRRLLVEAAWTYARKPQVAAAFRARSQSQPPHIRAIALKAQYRLHKRFHWLTSHGKPSTVAVTAVARELLGFMWAISVDQETAV
ncbi:MAG TPA: IS110 family transposase [Candidatus Binatia bacterium]|nr:IS110 family transposase [Candidatus Binatia bacterium]